MSTTHFIHWLAGCGLSSAPIVLALSLTSPAPAAEVVGYDQVKEILRKRCVTCHNPDELRGDLDLKELTAILGRVHIYHHLRRGHPQSATAEN